MDEDKTHIFDLKTYFGKDFKMPSESKYQDTKVDLQEI